MSEAGLLLPSLVPLPLSLSPRNKQNREMDSLHVLRMQFRLLYQDTKDLKILSLSC